jgi:hypothetical protein
VPEVPTPQSTTSSAIGRSLTVDQARSRIQAQGFQNVSDLRKQPDGSWRGKATRDGKSVNVILDDKGKISIY